MKNKSNPIEFWSWYLTASFCALVWLAPGVSNLVSAAFTAGFCYATRFFQVQGRRAARLAARGIR